MAEFPTWACPVFGCSYQTTYSHNIEKHLSEVHNWEISSVAEAVNNFFSAKRSGESVICRKSSGDPTFPVSLLESSRRRSVSSVGGGRGG
ncbi:hypothetical protein AKJ49_02035 [candidate division MSBL1 archaeon SCGC-AAA382A03]|uniref:Uncharacterized protein n=1 Tax=candidate division MSBL1 archaeon SCGC-AAA382A03 TaxID=1698278 RepID=A0A133VDM3_9EURY|nr:hypothetical protein AKJ49_02035 [candidate division MSBL1 archaeon SCGC-AAA382A03]